MTTLRLRAETADAHHRIERDLDWTARLASRGAYARWLAGLYGFHLAWERAAAAPLGPDLMGRRLRAHLAADDLAYLGWSPARIAGLDRFPALAWASRAEALGALYVVEGSALGGRVIAAEVERRLGLSAEAGCRYFHGHGPLTGQLWREVRAELARLGAAEEAAAVGAALRTFEALRAWLCRPEHSPAAP